MTAPVGRAAAGHAARRRPGRRRWLSSARSRCGCSCSRVPPSPLPAPQGRRRRAARGDDRERLGRRPRAASSSSSTCRRSRRCTTLFLLTGGVVDPDPARRDRGHRRRHDRGADRRRHDPPRVPDRRRRPSTLRVKGKDLTAVMDIIDARRHPLPRDARRGARARGRSRSTRRSGCIPLVIPEHRRGHPDPDRADPPPPGHRLRLRQGARASEAGYVFYIDPGPVPGHEQGLLGPRDPGRHARSRRSTPASTGPHDNVDVARLHLRQGDARSCRSSTIQEPYSKAPIPIPIPDITPLQPAARRRAAAPAQDHLPARTRPSSSPLAAVMTGIAYAGQHSDSVFGTGQLDVARYGRVLQVARRSSACAAPAMPSTVCTT